MPPSLAPTVTVVGAGITGLALAALLARTGRDVTVLERATDLGPVGAGLLLQHLGQEVCHELGIGEALGAASSPIRRVDGRTVRGLRTMQLAYEDVAPGSTAWGVHRGTLFSLLRGAALEAGARIEPGWDVRGAHRADVGGGRGTGWVVTDAAGRRREAGDLLVGADGAASTVRRSTVRTRLDRPYPWGALWSIVPDPDGLSGDALIQRWRDTRTTLGILPTGVGQASVFWSARVSRMPALLAAGPEAFVDEVAPLAGPLAPLVERVAAAGLLPARYRDVVVDSPVTQGAALVGDAAHAMSPQLGAGASLGLADAWTLAQALDRQPTLAQALEEYATERRAHLRYYRWWSRLLTPTFQSGLVPLGPPRDLALAVAFRTAPVRRLATATLRGAQTSPWRTWHLPPPA
ncbi:FAD-dependent oxidoreductase [Cellulomonas sp. S1-8]|uniref:FAD-dependent oxidoreductase n=1 Tax=Cellulomonas sp. S1-8 TaxID=2904790 RepID=UPI0022447AE6|nr:NAD(P)/FAD-dependent oxidoreductase [Cellulomonas sp. S1-8]UZN03788.1 FAD-dependent monooxygenase [Cellulomonas sp. S1-8]